MSLRFRVPTISEANRKVITINLFGFFSVALLIFYSFRSIELQMNSLALLYTTLSFFVILVLVFLKYYKNILLSSHLMVIALFGLEVFFLIRNGSVQLGEIGYYIFPGIYWYFLFPLFSFFLVGLRPGLIYNGLLLAITLAFFSIDFEYNILYSNEFRIRFLSLYFALLGLTLIFEIIRGKTFEAFSRAEKSNTELIGEVKKQNLEILEMVSELSDKNKLIKEKNIQLENLNIQKDKFFSILAHDLKNPFNSILGISEILVTDFYEINDERKIKLLKAVNEATDKTYTLLLNLLDWASFQRDTLDFKPVIIHLNETGKQVVSTVEPQAVKKNITMHIQIDENLRVYADVQMLQTILRNLLSNAIKYTNPGGKVSLSALENNGFVEVVVSDTGIGISPQKQEMIFTLEERFSEKGTGGETGTGLGLILCKEFVEKNGGQIFVESEPGKGSKFTFTMPVKTK
jgi:signal transduction histidine kinase